MKCALTRMRTLRLGRGAATVVPAVLCSLARNNLLLLQAEHVLQMQHLLSAGVELLMLFHTESAEAHHLLRKIASSVCLCSIHHLPRIRSSSLVAFIVLVGVRLGHLSLHVVALFSTLDFFCNCVHFLTSVNRSLAGHLVGKNGVSSHLINLRMRKRLLICPRIHALL